MIARIAAGAAAGLAALCVAGSSPQPQPWSGETASATQAGEWSAAKKRRYVRYYARPAYAYRVPTYGRLGDPSLGPNGLPYRRPYDPGGCIIDEGYGRFTSCSNR